MCVQEQPLAVKLLLGDEEAAEALCTRTGRCIVASGFGVIVLHQISAAHCTKPTSTQAMAALAHQEKAKNCTMHCILLWYMVISYLQLTG